MDRKRKRNSGGHNEADWTAARCQRLLRPISSRIAPLRKLAYITDSQRSEKIQAPKSKTADPAPTSRAEPGQPSIDPEWLRRGDVRPNLKGYSSKDRATKRDGSRSGPTTKSIRGRVQDDSLISLPTPFKARAMRRHTPSKTQTDDLKSTPCAKFGSKIAKRSKKDPFRFAPVAMQCAELHDRQTFEKVFELHQGVVDGFSLLLEKTNAQGPEQSRLSRSSQGARSLFSACLRQVPHYIQAEEDWRKSVDPDDETDVCAEVYEELEEIGSSSGWTPLREVVRAHGIKLVNDIIQDKLVSVKTRAELVNIPLRHDAILDALNLARTFAHTLPLKRPYNSASPLFDGCLASLTDADIFSAGSQGARISILESLFQSGRLHISWIAAKDMATTLSRAVRSLAVDSSRDFDYATQFVRRIVMQALELQSRPTAETRLVKEEPPTFIHISQALLGGALRTIDSLLTVLTAISIISNIQDKQTADLRNPYRSARAFVQSLATSVLIRSEAGLKEQSVMAARIKSKILASALISNSDQDRVVEDMAYVGNKDLLLGLASMPEHVVDGQTVMEDTASFICNLAMCCGQSLSLSAQTILEELVQNLLVCSETAGASEKGYLQQLALESALGFVVLSSSHESKVFAEKIEHMVKQNVSLPGKAKTMTQSRVRNSVKRESFRWEEGLCEWIAATPFSSCKAGGVIEAGLQTSPLPGLTSRSIEILANQSFSHVDDCDDMHDSGYLSIQETPKPSRQHNRVPILLSSPDVLQDEPRPSAMSMGRISEHYLAEYQKKPQANDPANREFDRSSAVPIKPTRPVVAHPAKEENKDVSQGSGNNKARGPATHLPHSTTIDAFRTSRKQRLLRKYGPSSRASFGPETAGPVVFQHTAGTRTCDTVSFDETTRPAHDGQKASKQAQPQLVEQV
ncbi:hypothetical protein BDV97DRAFT_368591 [Delphinella strobiligena]|nr:hypothetical protein BDV97DRAFT_368591 [Delphinella strobiligena]